MNNHTQNELKIYHVVLDFTKWIKLNNKNKTINFKFLILFSSGISCQVPKLCTECPIYCIQFSDYRYANWTKYMRHTVHSIKILQIKCICRSCDLTAVQLYYDVSLNKRIQYLFSSCTIQYSQLTRQISVNTICSRKSRLFGRCDS